VPGRDCQEVYQPAAAAESRAAARLRAVAAGAAQAPPPASDGALPPPNTADQLSAEAKGFLRDELEAARQARNKELADAAWQSLE
jgi:hypothetical protein